MGDFTPLHRWGERLAAQGLSQDTINSYVGAAIRLVIHSKAGSLREITDHHVDAYLKSLGNRSTARVQYVRALRNLFRYCLAKGHVNADPTEGLHPRKPRRPPAVALNDQELFRFLMAAYARHPRRAWTLALIFGVGCRRMEAAHIEPDDVQGDVVHLRVCKYGKQRRVELTPVARAALEELRPWYNGTVLGGIRRATITEWAHQAAVDAGLLPKVHGRVAHVLRASFITHLLRKGVPVEVVRDLVGHENISTTNDYAAVDRPERVAAAARLDLRTPTGAD